MTDRDDIRPPEIRIGPSHARIEPLWDRVDRNRFKLTATVVLFVVGAVVGIDVIVAIPGLFLAAAAAYVGRGGEVLASLGSVLAWVSATTLVGAAIWTLFALGRSERWLLERLGAMIVPKGEMLPSKYALKDMALAAGITPAPALYAVPTPNVNAFVFAASRRRPVIGVTSGLVERLPVEEQRAVFANLVARLRSGDTIHATGVTALTRPLWFMRDRQMVRDAELESRTMLGDRRDADGIAARSDADAALLVAWLFLPAAAFVAVTEVAAFGSRRSQLRQAEVADAEGMLLLREPRAMLDALESCIRANNYVPTAGPGFAQLFYCWTGDSTDDEEDPEWQRVMRLREVLGVEGSDPVVITPNAAPMLAAPSAPRVGREGGDV